jgi:VCBS repeat-containing protein
VAWNYSAQDKAFDFLAAGQTVMVTYAVTVEDGHGGNAVQNVVVTVTGTDDKPVITGHTDGAVTDNATQPNLTSAGTVSFTDVDLTDTHTASAKPVGTTLGTLIASISPDTSNGVGGKVNWSYTVADSAVNSLAAGQTKVEHFTVTVDDGHGGTASQDISITITGANDAPTIVAGSTTATGAFTHSDDRGHDVATGRIAFADVDLSDTHTVSQAPPTFSLSKGTLTDSQKSILLGASSLALKETDSTGSGSGSVAWTYSLTDRGADLLKEGQQLTVTYAVTVKDNHGASTIQNVVVTVTGGDEHESDPAGVAGSATNLGLTQLADVSSREVTVTGSPLNWVMDGATHNADGSWIAQTSDFSALTITPDVNFVGATLLNVVETWTNPDGSAGSMVVSDNVEAYAPGSPIFAVAGDDHLTSNGTGNLLVFAQPIGNDIVYNFNGTLDKIDLIGFDNIASFADIQSGISNDANGNAVIKIGADETITVDGIHAASLTASDFVFNQTPVTQNSATMQIGDGAHLSLSGTINNTGTIELSSTGHETYLQLIEHAITLEGGGHVVLSDSVENSISGTSSDVTLTNVDNTISGAGQIGAGQLTLINEGTIDATGANALTVDTGVNVVTNSGTLEANGSGGLIVQSDVFNSGVLWANDGHVTIQGAVSGNGIAKIDGSGSLDFEASSTANVVFGSEAAGALKLGDSFHFNGTISGFTGSDTIDLANVGSATASISYLENAAGTGGTLTVSDGLQSAELSFLGQYSADNFNVVSDHAKGTLITYVPHDLLV